LTNLEGLDLDVNPLDCIAYCEFIPTIKENNPDVDLSYDPMPEHCSCDPSSVFIRGNSDAQGDVNITDAIFTLLFLFRGDTEPPCLDAADTDDSGVLDTTDAIALLSFLFLGEAQLPSPFPGCGIDETEDALGCDSFPGCAE